MRKSGEGTRMNSQFCAVLEKAMIYTSALSRGAGDVAGLQDVRIHTKVESEEDSRCTNYFALHTKEHPQREFQPFHQGPYEEARQLTRVPPLHLWATNSQLPGLQLHRLVLHLLWGKPQTSKPHLEVVH